MSVKDPMFRDMQEYNRERDERDNERADRMHRENPPPELKCENCDHGKKALGLLANATYLQIDGGPGFRQDEFGWRHDADLLDGEVYQYADGILEQLQKLTEAAEEL